MSWIVTFVMIKIVPTFKTIFADFAMELTPTMQITVGICDAFAKFAPFFFIFAVYLFLLVWFGDPLRWLRRSFLHRFTRRFLDVDTPDLLRQIALTREAGKPIAGSMATLARCHHNPRTRRQILRAWNAAEHGGDPWSALADQQLITEEEVRVIRASETLDNTPWALRQLATVRLGKTNRRLQVASRLLPVFLLLPVAAFVALLAIGALSNLSLLIQNLS